MEHEEIVAVIEEEFSGGVVWQSASSYMENVALRNCPYLMSGKLCPPAEIYLFHMGKETLVQTAKFPPNAAAYHHAGPGCPEYLHPVVILPVVKLHI